MSTVDIARMLAGAGVSVIPIRAGTKRPAVDEWKPFQSHIPTDSELVRMFCDGVSIAAVCGPISGGLELVDFDVPDKTEGGKKPPAWAPFKALMEDHGHGDLLRRLILVETPSGGKHLVYRCPDAIGTNTKLAQTADSKVLIETRGDGGYFLIPPTEGYKLRSGSFDAIPVLSAHDREIIHVCARMCDQKLEPAYNPEERGAVATKKPGEEYNERGPELDELLIKHGWKALREGSKWRNYTRPGKDDGTVSAGISQDTGKFYVFSTNAHPFEAGRGYSKFAVYAILEHNGDFFFAANVLRGQGYGPKLKEGVTMPYVQQEQKRVAHLALEPELSEEDEDACWVLLSEIQAKSVEWFWDKRIPRGALTMIQGDPGIGKSFITAAIAATASVGGVLPCGQKLEPCHVVFVSTEDDPERVIKPRLQAMGADLSKISILATDKKREDGTPIFENGMAVTIDMIFRRVKKMKAGLLIMDPLIETMAALGIDVNKSNEVRPVLAKMRDTTQALNCATAIVHHQNKMSGAKSLYRSVGSIDIPASMRSVFVVGVDPDNPEIKAMAHVKSNWSSLQPTLQFSVDEFGVFGWHGEVEMSADDMSQPVKPREDRAKSAACQQWLKEYLRGGPYGAAIVHEAAKVEGYGRKSLEKAKEAIGVHVWRVGGKDAYWVWSLIPREEVPYDPMADE